MVVVDVAFLSLVLFCFGVFLAAVVVVCFKSELLIIISPNEAKQTLILLQRSVVWFFKNKTLGASKLDNHAE